MPHKDRIDRSYTHTHTHVTTKGPESAVSASRLRQLVYLLGLSLQRLQVVLHSLQLLLQLRAFAGVSRFGWTSQKMRSPGRQRERERDETTVD